jgi:ABC-type multidrug transport system fused ATPase/permease subunit
MGKLSIIRDIFASSFFRPLARLSYSALMIQTLMLFFIFFTHEQSIYYDHKNMMFIFFSLVFFTYTAAIFVALFFEYPFRTMAKVVFSPPKKILRLNKELARELNTNGYRDAEYIESELNESMASEQ